MSAAQQHLTIDFLPQKKHPHCTRADASKLRSKSAKTLQPSSYCHNRMPSARSAALSTCDVFTQATGQIRIWHFIMMRTWWRFRIEYFHSFVQIYLWFNRIHRYFFAGLYFARQKHAKKYTHTRVLQFLYTTQTYTSTSTHSDIHIRA